MRVECTRSCTYYAQLLINEISELLCKVKKLALHLFYKEKVLQAPKVVPAPAFIAYTSKENPKFVAPTRSHATLSAKTRCEHLLRAIERVKGLKTASGKDIYGQWKTLRGCSSDKDAVLLLDQEIRKGTCWGQTVVLAGLTRDNPEASPDKILNMMSWEDVVYKQVLEELRSFFATKTSGPEATKTANLLFNEVQKLEGPCPEYLVGGAAKKVSLDRVDSLFQKIMSGNRACVGGLELQDKQVGGHGIFFSIQKGNTFFYDTFGEVSPGVYKCSSVADLVCGLKKRIREDIQYKTTYSSEIMVRVHYSMLPRAAT